MVSTKDFSYLTLRLSLLNPGNVGRVRSGTGTSTCPACMYYKTKSIATFTAEQFMNSILYYHCAHSNQLMLPAKCFEQAQEFKRALKTRKLDHCMLRFCEARTSMRR